MVRVRQDGCALWWVSVELKHDREVVIEAVTQLGRVLRFASEELKGDREVVIKTMLRDGLDHDFPVMLQLH